MRKYALLYAFQNEEVFQFRKICFFIRKVKNFFLLCLYLKSSLSTNKKCEKKYIKNFWFSGFASSLLKYKTKFKLESRKFHILKDKTFSQNVFFFFFFFSSESYFLQYKKFFRVSVSWNIRAFRLLKYKEFLRVFVSQNIRKAFFWENIRNIWILEQEIFISQKIRKYKNFFRVDFQNIRKAFFEKIWHIFSGWIFFHFSSLGLKVC